jgi:FkbM family methyltransferase
MTVAANPKAGVYVQIGAGAGDQDARAGFRDGFTEYVKRVDRSCIQRLILVEPNPANIDALRRCWKDYPQAEILQIGIRPSNSKANVLTFYFAEQDAPHFQVFSMNEAHVRKHYPNGTICAVKVPTVTASELLETIDSTSHISLMSMDIEGIDAEVLLDIDWRQVRCKRLSFEFIHLGSRDVEVYRALRHGGYRRIGLGLDYRGYDLMYAKAFSFREAMIICFRWLVIGCWALPGLAVKRKLQGILRFWRRRSHSKK